MSQVTVRFTRPTLNYAKGDVVVLDQEFLDKVVNKYIKKYFEIEDRNRYDVLGEGDVTAPTQEPEKSFAELKDEALELGIDVSGMRSKAAVQEAIDAHNAQ